ncbi:Iron/zinc purple acid phosphatase-like protein [Exaiptasia diaphana]|nr:Iron/zinc purple acid phosphatase-like protein [Exaiptasia diaphana]
MQLNALKTKDMWISFKKSCAAPDPVNINDRELERVEEFKLLGVTVQNNLKWNSHVSELITRANKRIHCLRVCRKANLPKDVGLTIYATKIRPLLEHASTIWDSLPDYLIDDLERVQHRCLKIIGLPKDNLDSLASRRQQHTKKQFTNIINDVEHPFRHFLQFNTDYHCGGSGGWSPVFSFTVRPAGANWSPRLALFGDMGNKNARSVPFLQEETQQGHFDAILHVATRCRLGGWTAGCL